MRYEPRHAGRVLKALSWLARSVIAAGAVLALAGGGVALATSSSAAVSYTDTGLQVNLLHGTCPIAPTAGPVATGGGTTVVTFTAQTGDTVAVHSVSTPGVTAGAGGGSTVTLTGSPQTTPQTGSAVVDETYAAGCAVAFTYPVSSVAPSGDLTAGSATPDAAVAALSQSDVHYPVGGVQVAATGGTSPFSYVFAVPSGINDSSNGVLTVSGSTAPPGTYTSNGVTATDSLGASTTGAFQLVVSANAMHVQSNLGDYVNPYGNGLAVLHGATWNAPVSGWTATAQNPETNWLRISEGSYAGTDNAYRLEYAPGGVASGLCASVPAGDTLVVLRTCGDPTVVGGVVEYNPWQRWAEVDHSGTNPPPGAGFLYLINNSNNRLLSPNGTGAQLSGTTAPQPWGGTNYHWLDLHQLP